MRNVDDLINKAVTRRNFLVGTGSVAALAAAGCGGKTTFQPQSTPTLPTTFTDVDYLNFALNLEYLEASYYLIAATGSGLTSADSGGGPAPKGGSQVPFTSAIQKEYAYEIAQDELNHVRFLRSALGSAAVSMPAIDLVDSFHTAAAAAGIGSAFSAFSSFDNFLVGAFLFEDVGVTAYSGAAPLLINKTYLSAAAGIQAVEAYHAAEIRTLILQAGSKYVGWANQLSALRSTLGGSGYETALSATSIVAADPTNAIAFARTTSSVLNIVYANAGGNVSSGGFFPQGLNGNITATNA